MGHNLESVRFASLVEPSRSAEVATPPFAFAPRPRVERRPSASSEYNAGHAFSTSDVGPDLGLEGIPFTFALREKPWTPLRCSEYPPSFKSTVSLVLRSRWLPREIWIQHVLPWCPRSWFEVTVTSFATESVDSAEVPAPAVE